MPRLTYTPEGADPKIWDFSFGRLLSPERIAVEKMTGLGWQDVQRGFFNNQGVVIHALLFVLLKREISTLRADELIFTDDEIGLDLTDDEATEAMAELKSRPTLTEEEASGLAELEQRAAAAETDGPKED